MVDYLGHLSSDELRSFINDYYDGVSVKELKEKYKLEYTGTNISKILPKQELEIICPYCDEFMFGEYPPKSRADEGFENIKCKSCNHLYDKYCRCDNCTKKHIEEKKKIESEKRSKIKQITRSWPNGSVHLYDLNLKDKVFLGAMLREGATEDFSKFYSINSNRYKLSPLIEHTMKSINHMVKTSGVLAIHPDSPTSAFEEIDVENQSYSYYPASVNYYLNVAAEPLSYIEVADELMNPPKLEEFDVDEALELWREIAYYECLEYLLDTIENLFKIEFKVGEKTELTIKELLNQYSTSQIYAIIYYAGTRASRFKIEQRVSNQHAANYIIGACRSYSERAKANGWEIQKYHRRKHLAQSSVSKFLYERILAVGDNGFYEKIDKRHIDYTPFEINEDDMKDLRDDLKKGEDDIPF